jgi:threonine/homoserine/homoserine lactone efflux protein
VIVDPTRFALFIASGLALNVTPGPDMLFVLAAGTQGRGAGARAALGIGVGTVVHTVAATLGLSAVVASSASAFAAVKYVGAAYLLWIGVRALLARVRDLDRRGPEARDRAFLRAVVTNVLNPKVALFFLAFVPQFVDASRGRVSAQLLVLGLTFCATGTLVNLGVGLAAERLGRALRARERLLKRATGAVFVALGIRLALDRR